MGRLDSAMLWDDGLAHLLHIKAQRDDLLAALKEAKAALEFAVEQGGGPQCEHESGGAVCFCRENSAINSARAAIAKAEAGKVGDEG